MKADFIYPKNNPQIQLNAVTKNIVCIEAYYDKDNNNNFGVNTKAKS